MIEVSGRLYPGRGALAAGRATSRRLRRCERGGSRAPSTSCGDEPARRRGDVLVFLPGEREIREAAEALRKHHPPRRRDPAAVRAAVGSRAGPRVQAAAARAASCWRPTSPRPRSRCRGIRYVVDTGLARVKRYSYRNKVEQLRSSRSPRRRRNQRAGRCGRVADGICIRLYDEEDFAARPAFTDPEILRSSLAGVILRMKSLRLGEVEDFPVPRAAEPRARSPTATQLLDELGAVDDDNELTPIGRELARLPLDPRVGRMILEARDRRLPREVLVIAAALSRAGPARPAARAAQAPPTRRTRSSTTRSPSSSAT